MKLLAYCHHSISLNVPIVAGVLPPVIDSDDLLENPAAMTAAFCDAVGIPFLPEAHYEHLYEYRIKV